MIEYKELENNPEKEKGYYWISRSILGKVKLFKDKIRIIIYTYKGHYYVMNYDIEDLIRRIS